MLHISLKPDPIFYIGTFPITNTYLTSLILILLFYFIATKFYLQSNKGKYNFIVFIIRIAVEKIYKLLESVLEEKTSRFFPILASLFLFILLSNWLGLFPGVGSITYIRKPESKVIYNKTENIKKVKEISHYQTEKELKTDRDNNNENHHKTVPVPLLKGTTADLNTTLSLAIFMVIIIQYYGILYCGFQGYLSKFITFANPIAFFSGILEIISEFSKIISFAFRLFGNIFAGEVLLAVVAFLIPVFASFPFLLLEIFVGFIQALVFFMLSAVFLQMATTKQH